MSTSDISEQTDVQELDNIGEKRSEMLDEAGVETVGDLASEHTEDVVSETGLSADVVGPAATQARELLGVDPHSPADKDVTTEETFDDADAFIEAGGSSGPDPAECDTIAIIAGDGAFDTGGKHGDLEADEQAQLVQKRLIEFGFADGEGLNFETVVALKQDMGRKALNSWAGFTQNETDIALPELKQIGVTDTDADLDWSERYRQRNEAILEAVDGVCVVANGDYVGMWVSMVEEHDDVLIRTPEYDDEEADDEDEDDGPEWEDMA